MTPEVLDARREQALHDRIQELEAKVARVERIIPALDRARANGDIVTMGSVQFWIRNALGVAP